MRVHLDRVREGAFEWDEVLEIDPERLSHPDLVALTSVRWQGRLEYVEPGFLLTASYRYERTLRCQRCLGAESNAVGGRFELLLLVETGGRGGVESALEEEELGVVHVAEEEVEIDPFLIEQIGLDIPMKPVCRPDCAGLCQSCGTDLNEGPCDCDLSVRDPRWGALEGLKNRLDG